MYLAADYWQGWWSNQHNNGYLAAHPIHKQTARCTENFQWPLIISEQCNDSAASCPLVKPAISENQESFHFVRSVIMSLRVAAQGMGFSLCKVSLSPHRETGWSKIREWIAWNFESFHRFCTVKTCKQCLQTASAFGEPSHTPTGTSPWTLLGPRPPGYSPQIKISCADTEVYQSLLDTHL